MVKSLDVRLYAIFVTFLTIIWLSTGYVVFVLGNSGWWFVFTLIVSSSARPELYSVREDYDDG